jgi:predicted DNA-binding protein with PD1-like motif
MTTTTIKQINTQATRVFMGTCTNGEPIHPALAHIALTHHIHAATFELLGGLTEVELTAYDFLQQRRLEPLRFQRPLEIVAGHGTISWLDGAPHIHTHLTLAFRDATAPHGIALIGGHAAHAVAFAVEFTLTAYDGVPVTRALHPATGLQLWNLTDNR